MDILFVGGMLDGNKRDREIKGDIYMVPYYNDAGALHFQEYHRERLMVPPKRPDQGPTQHNLMQHSRQLTSMYRRWIKSVRDLTESEKTKFKKKIENQDQLRKIYKRWLKEGRTEIFLFYQDSGIERRRLNDQEGARDTRRPEKVGDTSVFIPSKRDSRI